MMPVRVLWTPYPHRGAFALLDDAVGGSGVATRAAYGLLDRLGLRATKCIWAFDPDPAAPAPTGVARGASLDDAAQHAACRDVAHAGHEIALQGASAASNVRARTIAAFERVANELHAEVRTFVPHGRNAENPYWDQRAGARGPMRWMLEATNPPGRCSGEEPLSPYYWGDVCRRFVDSVALFRTRAANTLAANPAMPYFEREKPAVRSWFSTTQCGWEACASPAALAALAHEDGLCVLRRRLGDDVDAAGVPRPAFEQALRRLSAAPDLWVDTVGAVLARMRQMQRVVYAYRDQNLWVLNLNDEVVLGVQIVMGDRPRPQAMSHNVGIAYNGGTAVIELLPPLSITYLDCSAPLYIVDRNAVPLDPALRATWSFGQGVCRINMGHDPWALPSRAPILAGSFDLGFEKGAGADVAWSVASDAERARLLLGHAALRLRGLGRGITSEVP